MPEKVLSGRCMCGDVRYEVHGKPGPVAYCHCRTCRRANGSAFAANAPVRSRYLKWISGREGIREYESSTGKFRAFCSRCGSPVYSRTAADPETFRIRLGTLDGDPARRAFGHFWVSEKASWFEICDEIPQYPADTIPDA
jgi:hypothetical protein